MLRAGVLAFGLMTAGLVCLVFIEGLSAAALAFAVLYGWSNGVMTIVRGTVPAQLFGRRNYGTLLGRLALPAFFAKAIAPVGASTPARLRPVSHSITTPRRRPAILPAWARPAITVGLSAATVTVEVPSMAELPSMLALQPMPDPTRGSPRRAR